MGGNRPTAAVMIVCVAALLGASAETAHAQVVDDSGAWFALFSRGDLGAEGADNRFRYWFDGHARFFDDTDGFGLSIVRPGVGYALSDSTVVWAGYGWIHASPATRPDFDENRIWQQVTWSETLGSAAVGFRSRLEQRFLETGSDTGWRFRQFLSYRRPLACSERLTFVVWDEAFFHLNDTDWGAAAGLDQNRIFVGMGWLCGGSNNRRIEVGYLNNYISRRNQADLANHLLSVNLFWNP